MVVCNVAIADVKSVDWSGDVVEYTTRFLPMPQAPEYLHRFKLDTTLIARLMQTLKTYDPAQDMLLLIDEHGRADINLLQHLAISPVDCYQQMQQRWQEFQLDDAL